MKIFKGALLFLPGVLFLFVPAQFMFYRVFSGQLSFSQLLVTIPWILFWGFAIICAIGNIRNPKHLYIPLSVLATAFTTFLISLVLGDELGWSFLGNYTIYLLPLVYAVPVLVKDLISNDSEET